MKLRLGNQMVWTGVGLRRILHLRAWPDQASKQGLRRILHLYAVRTDRRHDARTAEEALSVSTAAEVKDLVGVKTKKETTEILESGRKTRSRSTCKDCGGASICAHGRVRSRCKDCRAPNAELSQDSFPFRCCYSAVRIRRHKGVVRLALAACAVRWH
jgi:hypothetical protein